jgi:hypothetical protein
MSQPLITIDAALQALASATTPDELIKLANQAAALQVYARRAKLGMVAQNRCAEIRLRAERKLGELLTTTPRPRRAAQRRRRWQTPPCTSALLPRAAAASLPRR